MKKGTLTLKQMEKAYLLAKEQEDKTVNVPLYFGNKFIGVVPLNEGKQVVFPYSDKKGYFKIVYWKLMVKKFGGAYYKVQFYST